MDDALEALRRKLSAAQAEAVRVGDSPVRADRLADTLARLARDVEGSAAPEEDRKRILDALAHAERVLRRDDDGPEAARHLAAALRLLGSGGPRRASPFLD